MAGSETGFLLEYALAKICKGNKRELGRRLGLADSHDVYRLLRRYEEGKTSLIATDAILKVFVEAGFSIDDALLEYYGAGQVDLSGDECSCKHEVYVNQALIFCKKMCKRSDEDAATCTTAQEAYAFMQMLQSTYCEKGRREGTRCRYCMMVSSRGCPCKEFAKFIYWLSEPYQEAM